jgi:hypothetical protein
VPNIRPICGYSDKKMVNMGCGCGKRKTTSGVKQVTKKQSVVTKTVSVTRPKVKRLIKRPI